LDIANSGTREIERTWSPHVGASVEPLPSSEEFRTEQQHFFVRPNNALRPPPERVFIKIKSAAKAASKALLCNELHSNMFIECH
jgi:hypothetical protein